MLQNDTRFVEAGGPAGDPAKDRAIRLLIVDTNSFNRACTAEALSSVDSFQVEEAAGLPEFVDGGTAPDVVLFNNPASAHRILALKQDLRAAVKRWPAASLIVIVQTPDFAQELLREGARALLVPEADMETFIGAIMLSRKNLYVVARSALRETDELRSGPLPILEQRSRAGGDRLDRLTERQMEVLAKLADGQPAKVIATDLGIKPSTLKTHVRAIMDATGIRSRAVLVDLVRSGRL